MTRKPVTLRPWETLTTTPTYGCRVFSVNEHHRRSPRTGQTHAFWVLDVPDWVNIVPLTADRHVVMIRQYRHGIDEFTLEVPGGMVDDSDASPLEAARREMREETGYDGDDIVPIGVIHPNPAIQPNRCHSFLARDVKLTSAVSFDSTEECEVVLVPLNEISVLIRQGVISHALVVVAFHHLLLTGSG
jgi:ADP-ribose pyrophosphatase